MASRAKIIVHDYAGHPFEVQLSREFARRGYDVWHLYASDTVTPHGSMEPRPNDVPGFFSQAIPMNPGYRIHKYNFLKRNSFEREYAKRLLDTCRRLKPNVIVSANTPTLIQSALIRYARKDGVRFINWVQDFYSVAVGKLLRKKIGWIGSIIGGVFNWVERRTLNHSDHIIYITDAFKEIAACWGVDPKKGTVIENWAPLDELPQKPKMNAWSRERQLDRNFVFLYSGTLGMKHNPDLLLRLALDHKDDPLVKVVVISEGLGIDWLREQAKSHGGLPNLELLAYQPFESLPDVLASADVLIAILEKEAGVFSVPSKVLTYLCAGRPLLLAVPAANLASKIVSCSGAGEVCEPNDPEAFLNAARKLRVDGNLRETMAIAARKYAVENFDIQMIADRFEKVLGL